MTLWSSDLAGEQFRHFEDSKLLALVGSVDYFMDRSSYLQTHTPAAVDPY